MSTRRYALLVSGRPHGGYAESLRRIVFRCISRHSSILHCTLAQSESFSACQPRRQGSFSASRLWPNIAFHWLTMESQSHASRPHFQPQIPHWGTICRRLQPHPLNHAHGRLEPPLLQANTFLHGLTPTIQPLFSTTCAEHEFIPRIVGHLAWARWSDSPAEDLASCFPACHSVSFSGLEAPPRPQS